MTRAATVMLIGLLSLSVLLRLWLAWRQVRYLRRACETPTVAQYQAVRAVFAAIAALPEVGLMLALTLGGGIARLDRVWHGSGLAGGGMVGSVMLAFALLRGAVGAARSVAIDARFGVAHATLRQRISSAVAPVTLAVAAGAAAGEAFAWAIGTGVAVWWLWAALLWGLGLFGKTWLVPDLLRPGTGQRLRQRWENLAEGALRQQLTAVLARCGLVQVPIRILASPPGSHRANARLAWVGRRPRIELSDTLLDLLTPAEIEAVVAHEAGHWRCRHVTRDVAARGLLGLVSLAALALALRFPAIAQGLGVPQPRPAAWLAVAAAVAPLAGFFVTPLQAAWRRRLEYEADAFAARHSDRRALMGALAKLDVANATAASSDRFYSGFYGLHPDQADRIRHLDRITLTGAG